MNSTAINWDQLDEVQPGAELILEFKPEATEDLIYVHMLHSAGVIILEPGQQMLLEAVRLSGEWEHDYNRFTTVVVGPRWNRDYFQGRMSRALKSLNIK